jgi:hypothetical protein
MTAAGLPARDHNGLAAWLHSLSMDITLSLCQFITNSDPANPIPGLQLQRLISAAGSGNEVVLHARFYFVLDDGVSVTECQILGVVT